MTLPEALSHPDALVPHLRLQEVRAAKTPDHVWTAVQGNDGELSVQRWSFVGGNRGSGKGVSTWPGVLDWRPYQQVGRYQAPGVLALVRTELEKGLATICRTCGRNEYIERRLAGRCRSCGRQQPQQGGNREGLQLEPCEACLPFRKALRAALALLDTPGPGDAEAEP